MDPLRETDECNVVLAQQQSAAAPGTYLRVLGVLGVLGLASDLALVATGEGTAKG